MSSEDLNTQEVEIPSVRLVGRQINAVNALIKGVEHAQKLGAYSVKDASILFDSIRLLTTNHPTPEILGVDTEVKGSLPPQPLKEEPQAFVPGGDA
jgi:hypothetical protein